MPDKLKRLVYLPAKAGQMNAMPLEDVILLYLERLFPYQEPLGAVPCRALPAIPILSWISTGRII